MSKACASREEAEATVAHYADKGQPAHIEEMAGRFLVKRTADNKVVQPLRIAATPAAPARPNTTAILPADCRPPQALKSVEYSPAALGPILDALPS